jgi:excisionase family DNA binding protein
MAMADLPILGVTIPEAARILGCGQTKVKDEIRDGGLETYTLGHRRLVLYASMLRLVVVRRNNRGDPRRNTAVPKAGERRVQK